MSFQGNRESITWLQNRPDRSPLVQLPPGHAMSSRRLFLSGLLSSRARLHFAGIIILLSNTQCRAPARECYHEQSTASSAVAGANNLLPLFHPNWAGFPTLEVPDGCLKDRVHLQLRPGSGKLSSCKHELRSTRMRHPGISLTPSSGR